MGCVSGLYFLSQSFGARLQKLGWVVRSRLQVFWSKYFASKRLPGNAPDQFLSESVLCLVCLTGLGGTFQLKGISVECDGSTVVNGGNFVLEINERLETYDIFCFLVGLSVVQF